MKAAAASLGPALLRTDIRKTGGRLRGKAGREHRAVPRWSSAARHGTQREGVPAAVAAVGAAEIRVPWFDSDATVIDATGQLVCQLRQLAVTPGR